MIIRCSGMGVSSGHEIGFSIARSRIKVSSLYIESVMSPVCGTRNIERRPQWWRVARLWHCTKVQRVSFALIGVFDGRKGRSSLLGKALIPSMIFWSTRRQLGWSSSSSANVRLNTNPTLNIFWANTPKVVPASMVNSGSPIMCSIEEGHSPI